MSNEVLTKIEQFKTSNTEIIDLSGSELKTLPEALLQMPNLIALDLADNELDTLPDWLGQLTQLRKLNVSGNQLNNLPESLYQLAQLQELDVSDNQLIVLPESICQLTMLQILVMSDNKLNLLPKSLDQLRQLNHLDVSHNRLRSLTKSLSQLSQLRFLDMSYNKFNEVPQSIGFLTQLQHLDMSHNRLIELPESISQLMQLKHLDISQNKISGLPTISQLTQLESLYTSGNQLSGLPESLNQLIKLKYLDISDNELNLLPESIGQLKQLQHLNATLNKISQLPESLGQLAQLRELYLSHNQISSLPDSLSGCRKLQELELAFNSLQALPKSIQTLHLKILMLQNNPELGIEPSLLGKYLPRWERNFLDFNSVKPSTILAVYFADQEQGNKPLNEIKLLLVGRGAAGKTSIVRRLVNNKFSRRLKETHGIDISKCPLPCGARDITLNIWDFAGQVITHATHQFFLSSNSIYVLVLTGREDTQKSDADYWLRMIRAFSRDSYSNHSPVLIALNKWSEHPFKLDRNLLLEKYPFIIGFVETDCETGLGMDELKQQIATAVQGLAFIGQTFKSSWWQIKQQLEKSQRQKHYLAYSEFQRICSKHGETDAKTQSMLAEIFHALGIALNYGQDERLRNTTVLNPRWVTESIYKLLREAVADDSAELSLARVAEVLPKEPEHMQRYLLELMRRFDLAFPLNETGDRWLVPQRLPEEQPVLSNEWKNPIDATRLRYKYPVIPEGLLPRFITRTYPLSEGGENDEGLPRWANGVVLAERSAKALIRLDHEERMINVMVIGERNARLMLLGVIQNDFRVIHNDISGLEQVEELEIEEQEGVYVPLPTLQADEANRQLSSASTMQGTITVNPTQQLNRLSEPTSRTNRSPRIKIFISYSSNDARFKDELVTRLKPMQESAGLIECWHDRYITPGEDWDGTIRVELEQADVILLLVSPKFLASDYIRGIEVQRAVERAEAGEAIVIPIVLEDCGWKYEKIKKLNALPPKGKPIRDFNPQRKAWYLLEEELRNLFARLSAHKSRNASR
ncbi:MAG: leucine-rich repeat domain-containing protein [Methylomonas sp.]|nr:leucine-rich repeat domain-containing protein [Methylomonas sp.]